jgi:UDP-glucose 4-epimerase
MDILVTGAAGFVGNAIAQELAARGHAITALTRGGTNNLGSAQVLRLDLRDELATRSLLRDLKFDVAVHAAANMAGVPREGSAVDFGDNDIITANLLSGLSSNPPGFLLCISSIDVYAPTSDLIDEDTAIGPSGGYASSKVATEKICRKWTEEREIGLGVARLTQIFGTGDRTAKLIPASIAAIQLGNAVRLFGDGQDLRDFLFAGDAARMVADWCELRKDNTLNLATGTSISINEVLSVLREAIGIDFKIERLPRKKPRRDYRFSVDRLRAFLGPQSLTPLSGALKSTYEGRLA